MSDLKFLSDGRKVSVIGKINRTEFIVQEVFVTSSGDEIPSGENFTTKSLHDAPVQSYKEKEAARVELQLESSKAELETLKKDINKLKGERRGYSDLLKQNDKFLELFEEYDSTYLADVLSGNIEYCVPTDYNWYKVSKFEDTGFSWSNYSYFESRYVGLKMMSLFALTSNESGSSRKCRVNINSYPDGSGSNTSYLFFKNKSDLEDHLLEQYNTKLELGEITLNIIKELQKWIYIDNKDIEDVRQRKLESVIRIQEKELEDIRERHSKVLNQYKEKINE